MNSGSKGQASEQMSGAYLRLVLMLFLLQKNFERAIFQMLESIIKNYDELPFDEDDRTLRVVRSVDFVHKELVTG